MGPERETITTSPPTGQNVANCAANYPRNGSYPTEECKQFVVAEPVVSDANCENNRRYDTAEPINYICKIGQPLQDPQSALLCSAVSLLVKCRLRNCSQNLRRAWRRASVRAKRKGRLAALVFEDWNGPTSSQRTIPEAVKAC